MKREKALDLVYGRNSKYEFVMWFMFGILVIGFLFIWIAAFILSQSFGYSFLLSLSPVMALLMIMIGVYIYILGESSRHKKELKDKFDRLLPEKQEEILALAAANGSGKAMRFNDNYVYGNLIRVKKASAKPKNILVFEYLPLEEIAWIHMLENQIVMSRMGVAGVTNSIVTEKQCCVYTYKGECYKGMANETVMSELSQKILTVNPGCKFGYSKEMEKEFARKYGNYHGQR